MITLTAEEAFAAYEAVRHRLPQANPGAASYREVETLAEVASSFDVFLLDAFGVLNVGERAIPGACDRIKDLKAAGKRVLVVSNAASVPRSFLQEKYARLGFDFAQEDIITSRLTMSAFMQDRDGLHWGVMNGLDAPLVDFGEMKVSYLADDPKVYKSVEGFLLIGSANWTEERQTLLETSLAKKPRRILVANPDIVAPRETGFSAEPGYFAHRLADRIGVTLEFFGKPFENIFELAFRHLGSVNKQRVLMVGDSLHTDVLGAQAAGVASALVTRYGVLAGQDVDHAIERSGIIPNFIVERP